MNKYLLLRDNKQTGPYTVEEMVAKGFKAYDLVWLEGRSAAWRYPSEFPEFKQFAPVVEEQPYDRFFKKPSEQATPVAAQVPVLQEVAVIKETPAVKTAPVTIKPKKIYVTMPAGNSFSPATAANGNDNISVAKNGEYKRFEPLPDDIIPGKKAEEIKKPVVIADTTNIPEIDAKVIPLARRKNNSGKILIRSLVAACLILAGVVIGFYISFNRQQSSKIQLDTLVKQIQEREHKNAAEKVPAPQPVVNILMPDSADDATTKTDSVAVPIPPISDEAAVKSSRQPVPRIKKDATTQSPVTDNKSVAITASNVDKENEMKVTSAVISNKDKSTYTQAQIESARKNIYQQVSVESNKFRVGALGGISDLHITISNNSTYPLDQVIVEVKYFGPEKKLVKTQSMLFNEIAAGEQKTLEVPRTNRGVTIDYSVTQINSRVLGLAQAK